ncbi:MAG: alpha/beta fold hydrolase [Hyphomonadaceae bacterium]
MNSGNGHDDSGAFGDGTGPWPGMDLQSLNNQFSELIRSAGMAQGSGSPAAAAAIRALANAFAEHPEAVVDVQMDLYNRQSDMMHRLASGEPSPQADADARFADPAWRENPVFDFIRRSYLVMAAWAEDLAQAAPGLTDIQRRRAAFFLRQAVAAYAPSNTLSGNPRALRALFDSQGESVKRGLDRLQSDLAGSNGRPSVPQTDMTAFELGVSLAVTPGDVVFRNELIELIRYEAASDLVFERPLLIFPPWINKFYVLDLTPANSLVAWLRDQGFTVYMVSWRSADHAIRDFDWNDYLKLGGRAALDWIHDAHDAPVNVAGYCVGGALASLLAARLADEDDDRIASLSLLAAQTDFSEPGDLGLFVDEAGIGEIETIIAEAGGVMPGEAMRDAFNLLRPEDLVWRYAEQRYLLGEEPKAFDLLYWNSDQTNLPGPLHLQSLRRLYISNALANAAFEIEDTTADLGMIETPVFLHAARKDHISPPDSVYKGAHLFGGDVTFLLADSGHIAGVVNPPDARKYRYWTRDVLPTTYASWVDGAEERPGSWWPVWADWLRGQSGEEVEPPAPVESAAPAPGGYVLETLAAIRAKDAAAT